MELDEGNGTGLIRVKVDDREYLIDVTSPAPGLYSWWFTGRSTVLRCGSAEAGVKCRLDTGARASRSPPPKLQPSAKPAAAVGGRQEITAPMSGRVVQVLVQPGQTVQEGESLVIIEAMKMETEIRAIAPGQVKHLQVSVDTAVETGQLLLVIEP